MILLNLSVNSSKSWFYAVTTIEILCLHFIIPGLGSDGTIQGSRQEINFTVLCNFLRCSSCLGWPNPFWSVLFTCAERKCPSLSFKQKHSMLPGATGLLGRLLLQMFHFRQSTYPARGAVHRSQVLPCSGWVAAGSVEIKEGKGSLFRWQGCSYLFLYWEMFSKVVIVSLWMQSTSLQLRVIYHLYLE